MKAGHARLLLLAAVVHQLQLLVFSAGGRSRICSKRPCGWIDAPNGPMRLPQPTCWDETVCCGNGVLDADNMEDCDFGAGRNSWGGLPPVPLPLAGEAHNGCPTGTVSIVSPADCEAACQAIFGLPMDQQFPWGEHHPAGCFRNGAQNCKFNSDVDQGGPSVARPICAPVPGKYCRPDCTLPRCGDLVVDVGEQCDQGLGNSNQSAAECTTQCTINACFSSPCRNGAACANSVVEGGETPPLS